MKFSMIRLSLLAAAVATGSIGAGLAAEETQGPTPDSSGYYPPTMTSAAIPSSKVVGVTQAQLDASEGDKNNWIHSNMAYTNSRYYPADQIHTGNVSKLKPAFVFQT